MVITSPFLFDGHIHFVKNFGDLLNFLDIWSPYLAEVLSDHF